MIKKLAPFIGQYRKYVFLTPVFILIDVLAELSMPLLMSRIVDIGISTRDVNFIVRIGIYMVLLALVGIISGTIFMRLSVVGSMGFGANLRDALFTKVQEFSFTNIDRFSTASLVTRLTNDVNNLQMTFMMALRMLFRSPLMLIIAFILAYNINAELSIVLGIALPVLAIGVGLILRTATRRFAIVQERIDAINSTLQENLIGQRVVKAFVRADYEAGKFQKDNDALTQAFIAAVSIAILNFPLMMLVMNSATLVILWQGGHMVFGNTLGAGELISFISYVTQILFSIMMVSFVFVMSARAKASGERVLEVLETTIDVTDAADLPAEALRPHVTRGKVEFRDVAFKYSRTDTGDDILKDITFTIQPGEVVGVIGGTGTGKSTLVNLIPRLYDVTEGAVLVDDIDVRDYALEDLRAGIGMVLQQNTLFSGTIRENLMWGRDDATQADLETAARDAQAHNFIMSFPDGYDTQLGQGGVNLSGGQKQRLTIARAMVKNPKILILDDSTSAVDSATEAHIRESFYHNLAQTTVFIIAQRLSSVREADKIIVLDDGKIVGMGDHRTLLATNAIYQEINQSQQEGVLAQ
ncbi:MAG: putative ABC transporter ATP-binding protein [Chloroflexi bacterium ADurb.Bin325]|nr:MAG: putative ABC transporter ATP-binding protein [Chloroflexi bacterium ADurb.Bin325]